MSWEPPPGMLPAVVREWRAFYRTVLHTYGITATEYRSLYLAQLGRCYICRAARGKHPDDPRAGGGRRLGVDHNHLLSGRASVRGLLCTAGPSAKSPGCNWIIGVRDHASLRRAVAYLEESPAQSVLSRLAEGPVTDSELSGMATH